VAYGLAKCQPTAMAYGLEKQTGMSTCMWFSYSPCFYYAKNISGHHVAIG